MKREFDNNESINRDDILSSPHLKENPFKLPEGYFSSLEEKISARIKDEANLEVKEIREEKREFEKIFSEKNRKPVTFLHHFKSLAGMAAMFALIFGLGYGVMTLTNTVDGVGNETISDSQLEDYGEPITDDEFSTYIGSYFGYDSELLDDEIEVVEPTLEQEAIEDYLINEYNTTLSILAYAELE